MTESDYCRGVSDGYDDDESGRGKKSPRHHWGSDDYWKGYNAGYAYNERMEDGKPISKKVRACFDPEDDE